MKKNHLGSTLDDFLKEDRLLDAVQATSSPVPFLATKHRIPVQDPW